MVLLLTGTDVQYLLQVLYVGTVEVLYVCTVLTGEGKQIGKKQCHELEIKVN